MQQCGIIGKVSPVIIDPQKQNIFLSLLPQLAEGLIFKAGQSMNIQGNDPLPSYINLRASLNGTY